MQLVTRYRSRAGHGWYVGSDAEIVLAAGEAEAWPGVFEAYCRLRGFGPEGLEFRSREERAEFLRDVRHELSARHPDGADERAG